MKQAIMPQEVEVWYIIPSLRRELAKSMYKNGVIQKEIAKRLKITESAVSQYLKQKRAKEIEFDESILIEIGKSSKRIMKYDVSLIHEMEALVALLRKKKTLCKIHKKYCNLPVDCDYCYN